MRRRMRTNKFPHRCAGEGCAVCRWEREKLKRLVMEIRAEVWENKRTDGIEHPARSHRSRTP